MWNSCFHDLCLTSSLWTGCGGSAPGSSSVSWCRTQTASSGRLPRANRGPPHSWGPSGSTHKAQGPGCSSPQPHLNTTHDNYSWLQTIFNLITAVSNGLSCVHPRLWDSQLLLPHADGNSYCKAQWRLPPPSSSGRRCWTERLMELSVSRARRPYSVCWDRLPGLWYGHSLWSRFADMAPLKPNDTSLILETSSKV